MFIFEKFGQRQPLNRQAERYALEGVPVSLSTLADQVGACTMALMPLFDRLRAHVMAAERLHGDDTTVTVLAKGKGFAHAFAVCGIVPAAVGDVAIQDWDRRTHRGACRGNWQCRLA